MYKYFFSFLMLFSFIGGVHSADDAISQRTYEYLKRINEYIDEENYERAQNCLLYTSPSPRDLSTSRMPSSA